MFCHNCGKENDGDAAFCKYCGYVLKHDSFTSNQKEQIVEGNIITPEIDKEKKRKETKYYLINAAFWLVISICGLAMTSVSGCIIFLWVGIGPLIFHALDEPKARQVVLVLSGFLFALSVNHLLFGKTTRGTSEIVFSVLLFGFDQVFAKIKVYEKISFKQ